MSDHKGGSAFHQFIHAILHQFLRTCINGTSGFIQDQHRWICHCSPGNGQKLPLSLTQIRSVITQHGIVSVWQSADKAVCIGQFRCCNDLLVCSIQLSITDIILHCSSEKVSILKYDPHGTAQICFFDLVDIDAVISDLPILDIIETVQKIGYGSFSSSCRSNKSNFLPWLCIHFHIMEHDLVIIIAKIHPIQNHIPFQFNVICFSGILMKMLPCPSSGSHISFLQLSILFLYIHKGNISLICLRLLIQKFKDTFCSCKGHNNTVKLLAHLIDRHAEAFIKSEEAGQTAQGKPSDAIQRQASAYNGADHITQISYLCTDRPHYIGKFISTIRTGKKLVIQLVKFIQAFFLMAENLNHLLAFHHLFNIAVDHTQVLLLIKEVLSA